MSERLPVPAELQHLIESREMEERRQAARRAADAARDKDVSDPAAAESNSAEAGDAPTPVQERRVNKDRRQRSRRKNG